MTTSTVSPTVPTVQAQNGASLGKVEVSWDDMLAGKFPEPESAQRRLFREVLQEVAATAKAKLPASNGRVDRAVQIILAGDLVPHEDGRYFVGAQSDTSQHIVLNNECDCRDFDRAPEKLCKHVLASMLWRRAYPIVQERLAALSSHQEPTDGDTEPADTTADAEATAPQPEAQPAPAPQAPQSATWQVQEAPASCYIRFSLNNVECCYTMRDTCDDALFPRVKRMLTWIQGKLEEAKEAQARAQTEANGQASAPQAPATDEPPTCPIHHVTMRRFDKDGRSWFSHRTADGWCRGK